MGTLYTTIDAERTAEGTPLNSWTLLDLFGNDWSTLAGSQGLFIEQDSVPSATTPTWTDMQTFWIELPVYALDVTWDDLEVVFTVRILAHVSAFPECEIRIANAAETVLGTAIAVTDTSSTLQAYMEIAWPLASIPTGRVELKIQGKWASDPGTETLFATGDSTFTQDGEFYVRLVP